jgi:3-dehydroquinate dehydratase/shikimate dehydrogenase
VNNGKICVSVCAETAEEMIAKIKRAEEFADVIEVRFDCLRNDVGHLVKNLPTIKKTYLFTLRPKGQGGNRDLSIGERLKFWELVFYHHKSDFMIDIEADTLMMLAVEPNKIPRIVSSHDFGGVPKDFDIGLDVLSDLGGRITKLAFFAHEIGDSIEVWKLLNRANATGKPIIPIAMGEAGKWTRVLGLAHGACMTYASLDEGDETADGQITAKDLIEVYRVRELDKDTAVYGVIGDPVSSSKSPYMHNAAFAASNINAVFLPLLVKNLDEFIHRMVAATTREVELNFAGFSVTMPHKQTIIRHLDEIDAVAAKIGAVNTVKIVDDKLIGHNTDAHGFITPLKAKFGDLKNVRVAVLGAGGAARASVYALTQEGAEVTVFVRNKTKAELFADEFNVEAKQLTTDNRQLTADIVVNATPLGMKGVYEDNSPLTAERLEGVKFVYDLVTRADDTPIVCEAKKVGIPAIGGLEMLIAQGVKQFEIWTGRRAPEQLMRKAVMDRLTK